MPVLCRFMGVTIFMFWKDHNPPHFHARYGEYLAALDFEGNVIMGNLPPRVLSMIQEWTSIHLEELKNNWVRMQTKQYPYPIKPLE